MECPLLANVAIRAKTGRKSSFLKEFSRSHVSSRSLFRFCFQSELRLKPEIPSGQSPCWVNLNYSSRRCRNARFSSNLTKRASASRSPYFEKSANWISSSMTFRWMNFFHSMLIPTSELFSINSRFSTTTIVKSASLARYKCSGVSAARPSCHRRTYLSWNRSAERFYLSLNRWEANKVWVTSLSGRLGSYPSCYFTVQYCID